MESFQNPGRFYWRPSTFGVDVVVLRASWKAIGQTELAIWLDILVPLFHRQTVLLVQDVPSYPRTASFFPGISYDFGK